MEASDVYLMYCAMKAHFGKGDYDYVKYGGKSSATKKSFWKRNDRYFFVRILRKYKEQDIIKDYLISNFIKNKKGWLGNFALLGKKFNSLASASIFSLSAFVIRLETLSGSILFS